MRKKRRRASRSKKSTKGKWLIGLSVMVVIVATLIIRTASIFQHERITLVWATDPVWVSTVLRESQTIGLVRVPSNTYVRVPKGLGFYRIGVLWRLGEIEEKSGEILAEATQSFFGAPVTFWVGSNEEYKIDENFSLATIEKLGSLLSPLGRNKSVITNASLIDRIIIWWWFTHATSADIVDVDLSKEQVLMPKTLADGTNAQVGDAQLVDKISQRLFFEPSLTNESIIFRIYNSSNIAGFGNYAARLLTNIGLHVIGVENGSPQNGCMMKVPIGKERNKSILRVQELFNCSLLETNNDDLEVQVYLGESRKDR